MFRQAWEKLISKQSILQTQLVYRLLLNPLNIEMLIQRVQKQQTVDLIDTPTIKVGKSFAMRIYQTWESHSMNSLMLRGKNQFRHSSHRAFVLASLYGPAGVDKLKN